MNSKRKFNVLLISLFVSGLFYGCSGPPPVEDMASAEAALKAAKDANAVIYAGKEFEDANMLFETAKKLFSEKKYKSAHQYAILTMSKANYSEEIALKEKAIKRNNAEKAIEEVRGKYQFLSKQEASELIKEDLKVAGLFINSLDDELKKGNYVYVLTKVPELKKDIEDYSGKLLKLVEEKREVERAEKEKLRKEQEASRKKEEEKGIEVKTEEEPRKKNGLPKTPVLPKGIEIYTVKKDMESLRDIARLKEVYNDQFLWPLIYKANRDQIKDPQAVHVNQVLKIPREATIEEIIAARTSAGAGTPKDLPADINIMIK